ncbi:MAG: SIP domain-containing protein [Acidimicrobiia bacterium]
MVDDGDLADVAAYLDQHHRDTLLLIARTLVGSHETHTATLLDVDRDGCVLATGRVVGSSTVAPANHRVDFDRPATSLDGVRSALFALVRRARELDDATPTTSLEAVVADAERHELRPMWVRAVRDLTPRIREITLATSADGAAPDGESLGGESLGGDEYLRLTEPRTGGSAFYTVRRARPEVGEIDIWVVLHGGGDTSRWAAGATVGEQVVIGRSMRSYRPPSDTTRVVLLGDDTGLAAIARILDELPDELPAVVVADVDSRAASLLPTERSATSVHRVDGERWVDDPTSPWRELVDHTATTYYFSAGEKSVMDACRRHLKQELGVDRSHLMVAGYWWRD